HVQRASAIERADLQRCGRRYSCQNHGMQFTMRSETGPELSPAGMIGAESDEIDSARVVEGFHFFQLRLEDASELLIVRARQMRLDHRARIRRKEIHLGDPVLVELFRLPVREVAVSGECGVEENVL